MVKLIILSSLSPDYSTNCVVMQTPSQHLISTYVPCLNLTIISLSSFFHYMQHIGDFNFPRLADFGAAISGANKLQCQQVLEELDVSITPHLSSMKISL